MNFSDYISKYQWHLVPLAPNSKAPAGVNWGNKGIKTLEALAKAGDRFGVILGPSKMCSIDIDDEQAFSQICDAMGVDIPYQAPTIRGNPQRRKLVYRLPEDLSPIRKVSIGWGSVKNAFELRGTNGSDQLQDVLPPTIHPETKQPYTWSIAPPPTLEAWPYLPQEWVDIWENWQAFKEAVNSLDPEFSANKASARSAARILPMPDVINAFNARHPLTELLLKYGYKQCSKNKWISPQSQSKDPGVTVWEKTCYSHHASDGELSGVVCDAFELFSYYEHGNNKSLATKVAAKELGMNKVVKLKSAQTNVPCLFPDVSDKETPLSTEKNIQHLLSTNNLIIKYNMMSHRIEYSGLENEVVNFEDIDEIDAVYISKIKSLCSINKISKIDLNDYLFSIALKNSYHPAREWIDSRPWDGINRFDDLLKTIDTDFVLTPVLLEKWLIGAVGLVFENKEIHLPGCLVFQGEQYIGKSSWFKALCPKHLRLDGKTLDVTDKDSVMIGTSVWLFELAEIESTYKKDIPALKAFITSGEDSYRKPYARSSYRMKRRTAYLGSVNDPSFLRDETGNRRWWVIPVKTLNSQHCIDMQQLWAEMKVTWQNKYTTHYLSKEHLEVLNKSNEQFEVPHPILEALDLTFGLGKPGTQELSPLKICEFIQNKTGQKFDPAHLGRYMKANCAKLGIKRRFKNGYYLYFMP